MMRVRLIFIMSMTEAETTIMVVLTKISLTLIVIVATRKRPPGTEGANCCHNPVYEALSNSNDDDGCWQFLLSCCIYFRS